MSNNKCDKYRLDELSDDSNDTITESMKHLSVKMLKIQDSIFDALSLDDLTLTDKCMVSSKMVSNFISSFYGEKRLLQKMKAKKESIIEELIDEMLKAKSKKPIYSLRDDAEKHPKSKALDKAIEEQEEILIFFQDHLRNLKQFGFTIKASVDIAKLEN